MRLSLSRLATKDAKQASSLSCPKRYSPQSRARAIAFCHADQGWLARRNTRTQVIMLRNLRLTGNIRGDGLGGGVELVFWSKHEWTASLDCIDNDLFHCEDRADSTPNVRIIPRNFQPLTTDGCKSDCVDDEPFGNVRQWVKSEVQADSTKAVNFAALDAAITESLKPGGHLHGRVKQSFQNDCKLQEQVEKDEVPGEKGYIPVKVTDEEVRCDAHAHSGRLLTIDCDG